MEKTIYNQIFDFLKQNSILVNQQSGFRPLHSTETTLLHSANQCLINMDKGLINGFLFIDLKKAFDTVDHKILPATPSISALPRILSFNKLRPLNARTSRAFIYFEVHQYVQSRYAVFYI